MLADWDFHPLGAPLVELCLASIPGQSSAAIITSHRGVAIEEQVSLSRRRDVPFVPSLPTPSLPAVASVKDERELHKRNSAWSDTLSWQFQTLARRLGTL